VVARLIKKGVSAEQILFKDRNDRHVGRRWMRTRL
jgi:hypothetical protein